MKLKLLKDRGLLKAGDDFTPRTDDKGQKLIDDGIAELHSEQDEEIETEVVLYMDKAGNWKTENVPVDEVESFKKDNDFSAEKATVNENLTSTTEVINEPVSDQIITADRPQTTKVVNTKKAKK